MIRTLALASILGVLFAACANKGLATVKNAASAADPRMWVLSVVFIGVFVELSRVDEYFKPSDYDLENTTSLD